MTDAEVMTLNDVADRLDKLHVMLKEIARWTRFRSIPSLLETLLRELNTPEKKLAYEMTDGDHSRRDIAAELSISDDIVRGWWDKWYALALVEPSETRKGRPQKITSLDELGIEVPKRKVKSASAPVEATREGENVGH